MKKIILIILIALSVNFVNAQWQQQFGPFGGYVSCIAISGNNIFTGIAFGTFTYGVNVSPNYGSSWTTANNGIPNSTTVTSLGINGTIFLPGLLVAECFYQPTMAAVGRQ